MLNDQKKTPQPGVLIIMSAPSGCGKTTIVDRLLKRHPDWVRSVSVTTRKPRLGEREGVDYRFVDADVFAALDKSGQLLESAKVIDCYYGTPKIFTLDSLKEGKNVLLAIDIQGMTKVKKNIGEDISVLTFFILPPSIKVLRERLEGRRTDSQEDIERRIQLANEELKSAHLYDVSIVNQNLENTVLEIETAIQQHIKNNEGGETKNAVHAAGKNSKR